MISLGVDQSDPPTELPPQVRLRTSSPKCMVMDATTSSVVVAGMVGAVLPGLMTIWTSPPAAMPLGPVLGVGAQLSC